MKVPSYPCRLCLLGREDHLPSGIVDFPRGVLVLFDSGCTRKRISLYHLDETEGQSNKTGVDDDEGWIMVMEERRWNCLE